MNARNFRVVPVFCAPRRSAQAEVESLEIVRSITDEFLVALYRARRMTYVEDINTLKF